MFSYLVNPLPGLIRSINTLVVIPLIGDLEELGAYGELLYYYEAVAWYMLANPQVASESLKLCKHLRGISSFSMVFAQMFYQVLLDHSEHGN